MTKKISVIVNFHNGEKYIKECINSILSQTYENLEIILWDNCSDDKSNEIIKGFKDNRIKYFYNNKRIHFITLEIKPQRLVRVN